MGVEADFAVVMKPDGAPAALADKREPLEVYTEYIYYSTKEHFFEETPIQSRNPQ